MVARDLWCETARDNQRRPEAGRADWLRRIKTLLEQKLAGNHREDDIIRLYSQRERGMTKQEKADKSMNELIAEAAGHKQKKLPSD